MTVKDDEEASGLRKRGGERRGEAGLLALGQHDLLLHAPREAIELPDVEPPQRQHLSKLG